MGESLMPDAGRASVTLQRDTPRHLDRNAPAPRAVNAAARSGYRQPGSSRQRPLLVREEQSAELLTRGGQANLVAGQVVEQAAKFPHGEIAVAGAENASIAELKFVVEIQQRIADHLEDVGSGQRQLRRGLQVQEQPGRD